MGHAADRLYVYARLPDQKVVCKATGPNQRLWELGDVFEMFFQAQGRTEEGNPIQAYVELHVSPYNHRLQLRFPSEAAFRAHQGSESLEAFVLPDGSFSSQASLDPGGWSLLAEVDSQIVRGHQLPLVGQVWNYSLCRYDYDEPNGTPILSSTSPYTELDFHRITEWQEIEFE